MQDHTFKKVIVSNTATPGSNYAPEKIALFDETGERVSIPSQASLNSQYPRQIPTTVLGTADDGAVIQPYLTAAGNIKIPPGSYTIVTPLVLESNTNIDARGVTFLNATSGDSTRLIRATGKSNIVIDGLTVDGQKSIYAPTTEQRHGLMFVTCSGVKLVNVTSSSNKGDGFYFGGDSAGSKCSDVRMVNCTALANHRMGLTLASIEGFKDTNGRYANSTGTAPQSGCDIEPNVDADTISRVTFVGTEFTGNVGNGLRISLRATPSATQEDITLEGCTLDGNTGAGLALYNARELRLTGGSVSSNTGRGVYSENGTQVGITLTGVRIKNNGAEGIDLDAPFTGFNIVACTIVNNSSAAANDGIDALPFASSVGLTIIGGRISGASQRYGVRTGGNLSNFQIIGTDLAGNGTGTLSLADDAATRKLYVAGDRLFVSRATPASDNVFGTRGTGDSVDRLVIRGDGDMFWSSGSASQDTRLGRLGANRLGVTTADLEIVTAGKGLRVKEGSNAKQGTSTLSAGSVVVSNASVTASSRILLTVQSLGTVTAPKAIAVTARTAGTSFTITSADGTDTSVIAWQIFEPA